MRRLTRKQKAQKVQIKLALMMSPFLVSVIVLLHFAAGAL
jgi:hypothetical protein